MHSRIFQISKMWIEKENYLNEDTLHQGDGSFYDYCAEIDDEERKEDIFVIWSILLYQKICSNL